MSRKRFDEFYQFDGCIDSLKEKLEKIKISGTSTARALSTGGFFFGVHDNDFKNKRLAVVFKDKETCEEIYSLIF